MSEIIITDLVVPERLDSAEAAEFHAMVTIGNRQAELDAGIDDLSETAEELLPSWRDQTDRSQRGFIARRHGEIVGAAYLSTANDERATSADTGVMVTPAHWGDGVEQALLERVEQTARELGRSSVQSWTLHPAASNGRMLTPTTGWGRVSTTPLSELLIAHGYVLEQVERNSVLPLDRPLTMVAEKLRAAIAFAGDDYRVVSWTLPTPEHLRAGYADVISRMATDVPSGDLDIDEEVWDADRVVRHDRNIADGGQMLSVTAVEHSPTGRLVAFNELVIGADRSGVTHQFGTLVVKEHRGRRLGTIVKCANLLRWRDIAPGSPKVSTFNAEENRPMLDINEAIGFVPASYAGGWQKKLD
ncbi:GNAT family N-acetyltransferase [Microbacterium sp. TWP3-1-2b2]|uniref:GNAT family N-acetyltransferase n=1 Tax=Microbacterium sp. TWP3-1-2b2 TaxID=2804651 RepID=UPI003CEB8C92